MTAQQAGDAVAVDPSPAPSTRRWVVLGGVLVALFAFALFARTLDFGLYLDDHHHARPWTLDQVTGTFHGVFDPLGIEPAYFRPLPVVTFAADWDVYGFHIWGYHLTNILLHCLVCVLVYLLLRKTSVANWIAVLGAVFFAAIPANAATVVYISERSDAMVAIFTLVGLLCVHRYWQTRRWPWLIGVWASLLGSVGSKEVGFALILLVIVWWAFLNFVSQPEPVSDKSEELGLAQHWLAEARLLWRSIVGPGRLREWLVVVGPLLLIGAAYLIYRRIVLPTGALGTAYGDSGPIHGLASGIYWTFKGVPWEVSGLQLPVLAIGLVIALVLRPRDRAWRVVLLGFGWILAACIPLAPLGQIEPRLLYVAEIGVAIIVAGLGAILANAVVARSRTRSSALAIGATVLVALALVSTTARSTILAQDEFAPGGSKILKGDLVVWRDTVKRDRYPVHYLEQIEARLREAKLIDADGNIIAEPSG